MNYYQTCYIIHGWDFSQATCFPQELFILAASSKLRELYQHHASLQAVVIGVDETLQPYHNRAKRHPSWANREVSPQAWTSSPPPTRSTSAKLLVAQVISPCKDPGVICICGWWMLAGMCHWRKELNLLHASGASLMLHSWRLSCKRNSVGGGWQGIIQWVEVGSLMKGGKPLWKENLDDTTSICD